jgi:hypothetical protein
VPPSSPPAYLVNGASARQRLYPYEAANGGKPLSAAGNRVGAQRDVPDHPPLPAAITTLDFVRSMKILRFGFQPDGLATRRFLPRVVTFQLIIQGLRWN